MYWQVLADYLKANIERRARSGITIPAILQITVVIDIDRAALILNHRRNAGQHHLLEIFLARLDVMIVPVVLTTIIAVIAV